MAGKINDTNMSFDVMDKYDVENNDIAINSLCCEINLDRNYTNEKQRCVEQKIVVILGLSVFKQQHTQELKQ